MKTFPSTNVVAALSALCCSISSARRQSNGRVEKNNAPLIYAIEEPETSQHPHNQRLLVNALMDLAAESQVIISTHTPMLARTLPDNCLRYIHLKPDKTREVLHGGGETNSLFAKSLVSSRITPSSYSESKGDTTLLFSSTWQWCSGKQGRAREDWLRSASNALLSCSGQAVKNKSEFRACNESWFVRKSG